MLRRPFGIALVGGLIVPQLLTLYTTPVIYLYLDRLNRRLGSRRRRVPFQSKISPPSDRLALAGCPSFEDRRFQSAGRVRSMILVDVVSYETASLDSDCCHDCAKNAAIGSICSHGARWIFLQIRMAGRTLCSAFA